MQYNINNKHLKQHLRETDFFLNKIFHTQNIDHLPSDSARTNNDMPFNLSM